MILKIIALLLVLLVVMAPVWFGPGRMDGERQVLPGWAYKPRERRPRIPYKGPKTDARINRMLAESIALMKEIGVPISDSIAPEVRLVGARSFYGQCCARGSLKRYEHSEYEFNIEISAFALDNTEKSLRNTLIHELLHTVPGVSGHTGEWKKWAKYVSERTGYHISRFIGDDTDQDRRNLRTGGGRIPESE